MYVFECVYVYVCMYVCVYVCRYVCVYVCVYVYIYIYIYIYICMCTCMYVYMYVCMYVCMYLQTLDAVKTPVRNLDDVIKNWGEETKEDLRRVVRSFFAARLAGSKSRCCLCLICNKSCPDVCTFLGFLDCCCEQRSSLCIWCMPCIGENKALVSHS